MTDVSYMDDGTVVIDDEHKNRRDQLEEARRAFRMPIPRIGQPVLYHPNARHDGRSTLAWVIRINQSRMALELRTADGLVRDAVPYFGDPRLQMNSSQREEGAWEFTEEHYLVQKMNERIVTLERQVSNLITFNQGVGVKGMPHKTNEWDRIKARARELGCFDRKSTKDELLQKIAIAEKQQSTE